MSKPHWLSPPGATKTPSAIVSFDTETRSTERDGAEVLTLRCWAAVIRLRSNTPPVGDTVLEERGETTAALAGVLEAVLDVHGEVWAFAHNLGFDLAVTALPMVLIERGFTVKFANLGDESCCFVLDGEKGRLVLTDSWSWLRCSLASAARDVGMRQGPLPGPDAALERFYQRARHDAKALDALLAQALDWWEASELGAFAITGAACGWRSLRRKTAPKTLLVGGEGPRLTFEREALYGGRREVYRVGKVKGRWVANYDLAHAYLSILANMTLPAAPLRMFAGAHPGDPLLPPAGTGAICRVEVATERPCVPVRIGEDVWWPVGRFRTVLTSPELAIAAETSTSITVLESRWYRLTDACSPWAQWCLELLDDLAADTPPVARRIAKGWSRSVPGRFALRTSRLIGERPATHLGWAVESGYDADRRCALEHLTYGGVEYTYAKDQDGADVSPAVLAYIEGYLRATMANLIATRSPDSLLQVNTDGWWEVCAGPSASQNLPPVPSPYIIERRAHQRGIEILGPNHVQGETVRRLSGIPQDSERSATGTYAWHDWPGLRWQLANSRPGEYVRPKREVALAEHYCRRWVLSDGRTVPVSVALDAGAQPVILGWEETSQRRPGDELAEHQVAELAALA